MKKERLNDIYRLIYNKLREIQVDDEFEKVIEECRKRTYLDMEDEDFFRELVHIVFGSGMSAKVVLAKKEGIKKAFTNFDVRKVSEFSDEKVKELMRNKDIVRHKRKIRAIIDNAKEMVNLINEHGSFRNYLSLFKGDYESLKNDMIKRFKWVNEVNACAFQKYVGYGAKGMMKADVQVRRILWRLGLIESEKSPLTEILRVCNEMAEAVNENLNVVDEIIWTYGSGYKVGRAICGIKPTCIKNPDDCPLTNLCKYYLETVCAKKKS